MPHLLHISSLLPATERMDAAEGVQGSLRGLKPQVAIPMHYGTIVGARPTPTPSGRLAGKVRVEMFLKG